MIRILTLSWNGLDKLEKLRPGLIENLNNTGLPWIWYIRDNGSKDKTAEEIKYNWAGKWNDVLVLHKNHNRDNFAQGMNSLAKMSIDPIHIKNWTYSDKTKGYHIEQTDNDYYLLLNNDIIFNDANSLKNMLNLYKKDNDISIVGAQLCYPDSDLLQHAGVIFSERYGRMSYHYRPNEKVDDDSKKNRYFQAVTAAVCFIKCSDFHKIGGMNEKFIWSFEDIDLNLRIKYNLGKKIAYCGETNISHIESASLKINNVNKLFLQQNVSLFKQQWFGKYEIDHDKYLNNPNHNVIK